MLKIIFNFKVMLFYKKYIRLLNSQHDIPKEYTDWTVRAQMCKTIIDSIHDDVKITALTKIKLECEEKANEIDNNDLQKFLSNYSHNIGFDKFIQVGGESFAQQLWFYRDKTKIDVIDKNGTKEFKLKGPSTGFNYQYSQREKVYTICLGSKSPEEVLIEIEDNHGYKSFKIYLESIPEEFAILNNLLALDTLCEYDNIEELALKYEIIDDKFYHNQITIDSYDSYDQAEFLFKKDKKQIIPNDKTILLVYSKEEIDITEVEYMLSKDSFLKGLLRLEKVKEVEFYIENIPNHPQTSYIVVTKSETLKLYQFEGSYKSNTLKQFDEDILLCSIDFKMGIKHGQYKEYYNNGEYFFECNYMNGYLIEDKYCWKYQDGKILMSGSLRNLNGVQPDTNDLYNPNSQHRIGVWEYFDSDGNLIKSINYNINGSKEIIYENQEKSGNLDWL